MIDDAVELGRDLAVRPLGGRALGFLHDRLVEAGRWGLLTRHIDVAQVETEEAVPDLVHPRIVRSAEPPEPVATLRDQRLTPRRGELLLIIRGSLALAEKVPRLRQLVPGDIVFRVAHPGVEVRVDPGARMDAGQ